MAIRIVFFGTPTLAVPVLESLANDERFKVAAVVTQPAKPVGREGIVTPSPVADVAQKSGITILAPESVKKDPEILGKLQALEAEFFVVAAYGKIIPDQILSLPKHGCINVHPSLLPKYRGPSPLQATIANRDMETGVSIMAMDALMDHGALYTQLPDSVMPEDTAETLGMRLFTKAAGILPNLLVEIAAGEKQPVPQRHEDATITKLIERDDGKVSSEMTAETMDALRRAYDPWPGIFCVLPNGKRLKIQNGAPVASCGQTGMLHAAGQAVHLLAEHSCYELRLVQPEGKGPMDPSAFFRGYRE